MNSYSSFFSDLFFENLMTLLRPRLNLLLPLRRIAFLLILIYLRSIFPWRRSIYCLGVPFSDLRQHESWAFILFATSLCYIFLLIRLLIQNEPVAFDQIGIGCWNNHAYAMHTTFNFFFILCGIRQYFVTRWAILGVWVCDDLLQICYVFLVWGSLTELDRYIVGYLGAIFMSTCL